MQKAQKKAVFPPRRLRKRAVAVAMNGKVRLPVLARKLGVSLKNVRGWKRKFQGQIKGRPLPAKKVWKHVDLVQALLQRARIQSRIVKLKAALREA